VEKTVERFGRIDILVNNAGVGTLSSVADMSRDELDQVMNVNFFGLVECVQQVLPYMIRQGSGQIINISSIVGKRAIPRMSAYCASKFAVQGFSEALRVEVAPHNIDVTVICPPRTQTEFGETPMMRRPGNRVNLRGIPAERVARVILKAARRRRREVIISLSGKALAVAAFFFPGLLDWFFVRLWSRLSGSSGSPS
jgi:short-subunit dehydrogenase